MGKRGYEKRRRQRVATKKGVASMRGGGGGLHECMFAAPCSPPWFPSEVHYSMVFQTTLQFVCPWLQGQARPLWQGHKAACCAVLLPYDKYLALLLHCGSSMQFQTVRKHS